jgi:ribosomal protein S18 acetylase RimI-like enzyme
MGKTRNSPGVESRRLALRDAELAFETIRDLKRPEKRPGFNADSMRKFLSRPENILIVSTDGDAVLGFLLGYFMDRVDGDQRMVCLYEIEVAESHRRRGTGRALLEALIRTCHREGVVKVWTVTHRSNQPAVSFYSNTGAEADIDGDTVTFVYKLDNQAMEALT